MLKKIIVTLLILFPFSVIYACTSIIISGDQTSDGRPIMWKHRDTEYFNDKIMYFNDGKYSAVGLVDSEDAQFGEIWIGFNSAGFAIMNTMSYNIDGNAAQNAYFMREALKECGSLKEFEAYLDKKDRPKNVRSNFGVIDAKGNAAFFEVGEGKRTRFDVDDKKIAPYGYLIRVNYSIDGGSIDGTGQEGAGFIRREIAEKKLFRAMTENNLSVEFIIEEMMTSLENPVSEENARKNMKPADEENFFYFQDCINRYTSSSSVAIQGVKEDESPLLTTMWSKVGFPLSSAVVPVWITPEGHLPEVITAPSDENAEICDYALELKKKMVPARKGSRQNYINATKVYNTDGTGIVQLLQPLNREVFEKTIRKKEEWGKEAPPQEEVKELYKWFDKKVRKTYKEKFGLSQRE